MSEMSNLINVIEDISLNISNLKQDITDSNITNQLYQIDSKIYNINKKLIRVFNINAMIINIKNRIQDKL